MYNAHRGMGPAPGNPRLNELLDSIRAEFETQARASGEYEHSSKCPQQLTSPEELKAAHIPAIELSVMNKN
jgi:hypothetical protein